MYWRWNFAVVVLATLFMFAAAAPLGGNLTGVEIISTVVGEASAQLLPSSPDTVTTTPEEQPSFG